MEDKEICCPRCEVSLWDDKVLKWENKKFIKEKVHTFFYMPINFGSVMKKLQEKVDKSNTKMVDYLCLSNHTSKWNMDVYLAVDKEVPDVDNVTLSGTYYTKVYEGPFQNTGIWMKDFEKITKEKGYNIKKIYMWYTTCPKCAKKYGKNYVVVIAEI